MVEGRCYSPPRSWFFCGVTLSRKATKESQVSGSWVVHFMRAKEENGIQHCLECVLQAHGNSLHQLGWQNSLLASYVPRGVRYCRESCIEFMFFVFTAQLHWVVLSVSQVKHVLHSFLFMPHGLSQSTRRMFCPNFTRLEWSPLIYSVLDVIRQLKKHPRRKINARKADATAFDLPTLACACHFVDCSFVVKLFFEHLAEHKSTSINFFH